MKYTILISMLVLLTISCSKKTPEPDIYSMLDEPVQREHQPQRVPPQAVEEEVVYTPPPPPPTPPVETPRERQPEIGPFTAQLISLQIEFNANRLQNKLKDAGYQTVISEAVVNDLKMFRIRLDGSYSRDYAEYLANKIKDEFKEVEEFWIVRKN